MRFVEKEKELQKKWFDAICGISAQNGTDITVSWLMLCQNVRNLKDGLPVYKGAEVDYTELEKDLQELDTYRRG